MANPRAAKAVCLLKGHLCSVSLWPPCFSTGLSIWETSHKRLPLPVLPFSSPCLCTTTSSPLLCGAPVGLWGLPDVSRALCHSWMYDSIPDGRHSRCAPWMALKLGRLCWGVFCWQVALPQTEQGWSGLGDQDEVGSADAFLLPADVRRGEDISDLILCVPLLDCFFGRISNLPLGSYFEVLLLLLKIFWLDVSTVLNDSHLISH